MSYEEFKQEQELNKDKKRKEANTNANRDYNQGLLDGLGFFNAYLYPILKRKDT